MKNITIYTDGACLGNPGRGGWGAVLLYGDNIKKISGAEMNTTNNRMELLAAIKALNALKKSAIVDLYTDSNYVRQGITNWIHNWRKNGWKTANRKPVKNAGLWQDLQKTAEIHKITYHWVKGHSGDKYNDMADLLATEAAKNIS